jgi:hypothetical protein
MYRQRDSVAIFDHGREVATYYPEAHVVVKMSGQELPAESYQEAYAMVVHDA